MLSKITFRRRRINLTICTSSSLLMKMRTAPMDIAGLARFILSPECKSIAILSGAGISVASGIPDFRSPGGMYQTLRPERITATPAQRQAMQVDPTNVVTWDMFRVNQFPYLEVRRPFILGTQQRQWKATIAHRFAELLHVKTNKLTRVYTQNIDGLDRQCEEIPLEKMVYVHGTISQVKCEGCGHDMDFDEFCQQVRTNIRDIYQQDPPPAFSHDDHNDNHGNDHEEEALQSPVSSSNIDCAQCGKPLVKPSTVLFGRSLPSEFFDRAEEDLPMLDLLLIMGTSLVVSPANSLVSSVPPSTMRVVINVESVGEFLGIDYSDRPNKQDLFLQGTTDEICLQLIKELGWIEDLKCKKDVLPPSSVKLLQQYE